MINVVQLAGTMIKDPDLVDLRSGSLRADFTLAVKSVRYDRESGCDTIDSCFISCQAWESSAELIAALHKGCVVMVVGQLTQQETDKDGRKERKTKVRVLTVSPIRIPTEKVVTVPDPDGEF